MTEAIEVKKPRVIKIEFSDLDDETLYMDYDLSNVSPRHIAIAILNLSEDLTANELRSVMDVMESRHTDKLLDDQTKRLSN